jgi:beta-lactam-binding protein with PASTA domain
VPGTLADYTNRPFLAVFTELNGLHMGVNVKFTGDGTDNLVQKTDPAAGTPIHNGLTVTLTVSGQPPAVTPPDLTGKSCASGDGSAGSTLYLAGLKVMYADSQRAGVVLSQDKTPSSTDVKWNDTVTVTCGTSAASPSGATNTAG